MILRVGFVVKVVKDCEMTIALVDEILRGVARIDEFGCMYLGAQ